MLMSAAQEREQQLQADRALWQRGVHLQLTEPAHGEAPANLTSACMLAASCNDGANFRQAQSSALIRHASAPSPVRIPPNSIGLTYLHSLLSADECAQLLTVAEEVGYKRSETSSGINPIRTSFSAELHADDAFVVASVRARIAQLVGVSEDQLENLQVVRYEVGQQYEPHYDSTLDEDLSEMRQFTLFSYLNSLEDGAGGQTDFINIGVQFAPRQGDALWWRNHADRHSAALKDGEHAGRQPLRGIKYGLNCWISFADEPPAKAPQSIRRRRIETKRALMKHVMRIADGRVMDDGKKEFQLVFEDESKTWAELSSILKFSAPNSPVRKMILQWPQMNEAGARV